ncbi:MAG TPA: ribosome maturation factor [Chitinophagaceae bacterium]|nr:ribosome maturation factor [Chitinophagaceae bacterium]
MNAESQIKALTQKIEVLISDKPGFFLVDIRIQPTNNIKVFIDADQGIIIDELVQLNRKLYRQLEESGMFPGNDFSLEISSPGLDEPLKLHRQYLKNTGRVVEVVCKDGIKTAGKLISVSDAEIVIEEEKGKGKKKELVNHTISFENIKSTKIQIKI